MSSLTEVIIQPNAPLYNGPLIPYHRLDEWMYPVNIPINHIFKAPADFAAVEAHLHKTLAVVLSLFPPLYSTIIKQADGSSAFDCTKVIGTPFVTEHASVPFDAALHLNSSMLSARSVFGSDEAPKLSVKLTRFSCGTLALCSSIYHKVADLGSVSHFVKTWARVARLGVSSSDGLILLDRQPTHYFGDAVPDPLTKLPMISILDSVPTEAPPADPPSSTITFTISPDVIKKLKSHPSIPKGSFVSTADIMGAFGWKAVVRAHSLAGYFKQPQSCAGIAMNARPRIPGLAETGHYFGNLVTPYEAVLATESLLDGTEEGLIKAALLLRRKLEIESQPSFLHGHLALLEKTSVQLLRPHVDTVITNWSTFNLTSEQYDFGFGTPVADSTAGSIVPAGFFVINKNGDGDFFLLAGVVVDSVDYIANDPLFTKYGKVVKNPQ